MPTRMPDWWTVPYPELTTVKAASAYIDAIGGSLSRAEENGWWVLSTGTQELVRAATPAELDTFVLGFALAHLICERHGPIARTEPAVAAAPPPPPAPPVAVAATPVSTEASPPPPPPPPVAAAAEAGELDEDDGEPEHTTTLSVVPDVDDEDGTDLETPAGSPFERGFESGFDEDEDEEEEEGDLGDEPSMSAAPPLGRSSGRRRRRRR